MVLSVHMGYIVICQQLVQLFYFMTRLPLWGIGGICLCSSGSTAHFTETLILIVNDYDVLPYESMLEVHAGYDIHVYKYYTL